MTDVVVFNPANINIPTKKLNSVQLKQYQEYASQLVEEISQYIREIKNDKISTFENANRKVLEEELIKKNKLDKVADKLNNVIKELYDHSQLVAARRTKYDKEKEELESKFSADITEFRVTGNKLFDAATKVYDTLKAKEDEMTENNEKSTYELESRGHYFTYADNGTFQLNYQVQPIYSVNPNSIIVKPESFINSNIVDSELKKRVRPLIAEWTDKEEMIKDLAVSSREILMFDETKINQVFEQLVTFRNAVKVEWRKISNKEDKE